MVCDLPVPGGPLTTRWAPERTASMAACWVRVGVEDEQLVRRVGVRGELRHLRCAPRAARRGRPRARRRRRGRPAKSPCAARSATMGSLAYEKVPTTSRGVIEKSGTPGAELLEPRVDGVGVEAAARGSRASSRASVSRLDALLGAQVVLEHRVELDVVAEVEVEVLAGGTGRLAGRTSAAGPGPPGAAVAPRTVHVAMPMAMKPAAMPRSSASSTGLGPDGACAPPGLVEGRGLADQVGQPGGPAGEQHGEPAGVGGGEVEGAGGEVAVPEQGVAPAEVDEVALPGLHGRGDAFTTGVGRRQPGLVGVSSVGWFTCAG